MNQLCKSCKRELQLMITEEDQGLLKANKMEKGTEKLILQCFYAGRLALLIDLVRGTNTTPEIVIKKMTTQMKLCEDHEEKHRKKNN